MSVLEIKAETDARDYAEKECGCVTIKLNVRGQKGWPDVLFITPEGLHFFIEFKRPGEKPTKLQKYRISILQDMGVAAHWTDNYDDAVEIIDHYVLESERLSGKGNQVTPFAGCGWPIP